MKGYPESGERADRGHEAALHAAADWPAALPRLNQPRGTASQLIQVKKNIEVLVDNG